MKIDKVNFKKGPACHRLRPQTMADGQAVMATLIIFIIISLILISGGTLPTGMQIKNSDNFLRSRQNYAAADSLNDNAYYLLKKGYSVSTGTTLPFLTSGISTVAAITDLANKKQIISSGNSTSNIGLSKMILSQNFGTVFKYALQVGTGGLSMTNATVNGDLYTIGNVSGDSSSIINGSTSVAYQNSTNVGKILGSSNSQWNPIHINGNAWAHEIDYAKVSGTGFCKTSNYLLDSSGSVENCNTGKVSDPSMFAFPITDTNISDWKNAVSSQTDTVSGTYTYNANLSISDHTGTTSLVKKINGNLTLSCDSSTPANFGNLYVTGDVSISSTCILNVDALHIGGNLSISGSGILNLSGMNWVHGNINISGSGKIQLDSSLGASSGYVISDGIINISGSGALNGSGTTGSFIMMITTSTSATAITVSGGGSAALLVAPNGTVVFSNGSLNGIVAKAVSITGGNITYQSNLADIIFGGPSSGAWHVLNWSELPN